jgi:antitoxin Phd
MGSPNRSFHSPRGRKASLNAGLPSWKLEGAKARFSEVVRLARERGPQRVTVHGRDAVVVVSAADYARLAPAAAKTSLAALFADGPFSRLERFEDSLVRARAPVRDVPDLEA